MTEFLVFTVLLLSCSLAAGTYMARRGEQFRTWAALGFTMGPFVVAYARLHVGSRRVPVSPDR